MSRHTHIDTNDYHIFVKQGAVRDPEAGLLCDNNCIVVARKVNGHEFGRDYELTRLASLWASAHGPGDTDAKAMYHQGKDAIKKVGILWSKHPDEVRVIREGGREKLTFLDTETPGFAEYSGHRGPAFPQTEDEFKANDARAGLEGFYELTGRLDDVSDSDDEDGVAS